jgi:predicted histone-like DNA-binding protein
MSIKVRKIQRINPQNRDQKKWYYTQEKSGTVGFEEIAKAVAERTSHAPSDVRSILANLVNVMPDFLKLGQTINLEGFGAFHMAVLCDGVDTAEELSTGNIHNTKLRFLPSIKLKHNLKGLAFEGI